MKPSRRLSFGHRFACLALAYALLASLCTPLVPRGAAAASPSAGATAVQPTGQRPAVRDGELLVRFRDGVAEYEREALIGARRGRRRGGLRGASGVERVEVEASLPPEVAAAELRSLPAVEFAEPNYLVRAEQAGSADPRFAEQWALKNAGQTGGTAGSDVGAEAAWQKSTGSRRSVIAVIDSGIDFSHPDLANNRWANPRERENNGDDDRDGFTDDLSGWDWIAQGGRVTDPNGHGTSVAGIIAAEGDNGTGVTGVMWRASLMSLRVLDETGTGDVAAAVEAIDYAVEHGASVINLSWGTGGESRALRDAIARAGRRGVLVVCSAGNAGRSIDAEPYYPASYDLPNLLAVAASDNSDRKAAWSNWGARSVGVAAPGADILTTQSGGGYRAVSGTSAAAPHVAGVAGLVKSLYPGLGAEGVRAAILRGVKRVAWLDGAVAGGGVVAADGALDAAGALPAGGAGGNGGGGNGGGQGDGQGDGEGQGGAGNGSDGSGGGGHGQSPRPGAPGRGTGGRGPNGSFDVEPPAPYMKAPPGFGDHDEIRRGRRPAQAANAPISADDIGMPVCDADCGDSYPAGGATLTHPSDPRFGTGRTRVENQTGQAGTDLGSRNFNWGLPLVGLAGRAGLDLSVGLYYNSLVWTRQDRTVQFNGDHGFPGPGFRLGFPVLQGPYYDHDIGANAYVLVTPSGGRVEMRQVAAYVYESADATYTRLTIDGAGTVVRTADGTQLRFILNSSQAEYRCVEIKDRNGNYITVNYDQTTTPGQLGRPTSVVDTLGRTLTFNYSQETHYLTSITQTRRRDTPSGLGAPETHAWATFDYAMLAMWPNFADQQGALTPVGPQGGAQIPVLKKVTLPDGTYFEFEYTSWGQVNRISRKSPAGWLLSRTTYGLSSDTSSVQSDCPRVMERREWATWSNGDLGDNAVGPAEEAITTYAVAADDSWTQVTPPDPTPGDASDNVVYKEFFHTTGWRKGLTTRTEVLVGGALKKWTTVGWTQDDINAPYQLNPRPAEMVVEDSEGNRRRTALEYTSYSLPQNVREYTGAAGAEMLGRRTYTEYRWDAAWIDRRIIGLVAQRHVFEGESALVSKVEYGYDWDSVGFSFYDTPAPAAQHDRANYGPSFIYGRGNLTFVARFDVTDPENRSKMSETKMGVNSTGSLVMAQDHDWHRTSYDYSGVFTDGSTHNAYAFPTKVTDADGYHSTAQYNYDMGVLFRAVDPKGAEQKNFYDAAGRVERELNVTNGAYTEYSYNPDSGHFITNTTVEAGRGLAYTNTIVDGRGQVRLFVGSHPNSAGGYLAVRYGYDALGRRTEQTNPTEIYGDGNPAGDDLPAGYQRTLQAYDWQGRPTVTTYPTGNTVEVSYGGCGCAGGEVATVRDERGRRKKYTKDGLGRLAKVEELNWDTSVYSTTNYSYNARDQITAINQQGQPRTMQYDGHGRLWKRTTPEQGTTEYAYNRDDTVWWAKDARGAKTEFSYNARHLPWKIEYKLGEVAAGQDVAQTATAQFGYDAAGNRTSMADGLGSVSYDYDALSRLRWEERVFTGIGTYRLSYEYNLAGQLTRVKNPWDAEVAYEHDANGRTTQVRGTNAGGTPTYYGVEDYAHTMRYRAFGGLKAMTYGNSAPGRVRGLAAQYDKRQRLTRWDVAGVLGYEYRYDNSNDAALWLSDKAHRVVYAKNVSSDTAAGGGRDASLDRSYDYDHVGRLQYAHSGVEARMHAYNQANDGGSYGPYAQHHGYDVWGNLTSRAGWGGANPSYAASYTDNRRAGLTYDLAGNVTHDGGQAFRYDATGQQVSAGNAGYSLSQWYDGDGLRAKKADGGEEVYYLRSSALGGRVVAEVRHSSQWGWYWSRGYVYAGAQLLAVQYGGAVTWAHQDPVVKSQRLTDGSGNVTARVELDPWGGDTSRSWQQHQQPQRFTTYQRDANESDEAMFRRYNRWWSRFDQPDPYDGSYDLSDPQSLNRYSYTQNDPVNFIDPTGLSPQDPQDPPLPPGWDDHDPANSIGKINIIERLRWFIGGGPILGGEVAPVEGADGPGGLFGGGVIGFPAKGVNDVNVGFTLCGMVASAGEFSNVVNGRWVGWTQQGPRTYSMGWGGNQHVSRSAAVSKAGAFRALGRVSFAATGSISAVRGVNAVADEKYGEAAKHGLDLTMGYVAVRGGVPGAIAGGTYFTVDMTVGWRAMIAPTPRECRINQLYYRYGPR